MDMRNTWLAAAVAVLPCAAVAPAANAITPAMPQEVVCPLTGERFTFTGEYGSFTSFGRSLDFEPLVMGMLRRSPTRMPQCPDSGLPLYRAFKPEEMGRLRAMVGTPAWQERRAVGSAAYLVAYTKWVLGEGELPVAQSLLAAVWGATEENRALLLGKALEAWGRIADGAGPRDANWVAANWLRVDLHRQLGKFEQAETWLRDFEGKTQSGRAPVTDAMVATERQLITARDSRPAAVPRDPAGR